MSDNEPAPTPRRFDPFQLPKKWKHAGDPTLVCTIDNFPYPAATGMDAHQLDYWMDRVSLAMTSSRSFRQNLFLLLLGAVLAGVVSFAVSPSSPDPLLVLVIGLVILATLPFIRPGASADNALEERWLAYRRYKRELLRKESSRAVLPADAHRRDASAGTDRGRLLNGLLRKWLGGGNVSDARRDENPGRRGAAK